MKISAISSALFSIYPGSNSPLLEPQNKLEEAVTLSVSSLLNFICYYWRNFR